MELGAKWMASDLSIECDFEQMRRRKTAEHVIEQLVSLISSGKIEAGEKLPSEARLMKQLGVGRSSLREAISVLTFTGLLVIQPGKGTYVNANKEDFLARPLKWGIPLGNTRIRELIEARSMIEGEFVLLSSQRASPAHIKKARLYLNRQKRSKGNLQRTIHYASSFHYATAQACGNGTLITLYNQIRNLMSSWVEEAYKLPGFYEESIEAHSALLDAIASHDIKKAQSAACKHLESMQHALSTIDLNTAGKSNVRAVPNSCAT